MEEKAFKYTPVVQRKNLWDLLFVTGVASENGMALLGGAKVKIQGGYRQSQGRPCSEGAISDGFKCGAIHGSACVFRNPDSILSSCVKADPAPNSGGEEVLENAKSTFKEICPSESRDKMMCKGLSNELSGASEKALETIPTQALENAAKEAAKNAGAGAGSGSGSGSGSGNGTASATNNMNVSVSASGGSAQVNMDPAKQQDPAAMAQEASQKNQDRKNSDSRSPSQRSCVDQKNQTECVPGTLIVRFVDKANHLMRCEESIEAPGTTQYVKGVDSKLFKDFILENSEEAIVKEALKTLGGGQYKKGYSVYEARDVLDLAFKMDPPAPTFLFTDEVPAEALQKLASFYNEKLDKCKEIKTLAFDLEQKNKRRLIQMDDFKKLTADNKGNLDSFKKACESGQYIPAKALQIEYEDDHSQSFSFFPIADEETVDGSITNYKFDYRREGVSAKGLIKIDRSGRRFFIDSRGKAHPIKVYEINPSKVNISPNGEESSSCDSFMTASDGSFIAPSTKSGQGTH